MKNVMETQRKRLTQEKEAAVLLLAERDISERRRALLTLRQLQAQCKDLEELLALKGTKEEKNDGTKISYQEVAVCLQQKLLMLF